MVFGLCNVDKIKSGAIGRASVTSIALNCRKKVFTWFVVHAQQQDLIYCIYEGGRLGVRAPGTALTTTIPCATLLTVFCPPPPVYFNVPVFEII